MATSTWVGFSLLAALALLSLCSAIQVEYDSRAMIIDGQRKIIISGSIHYTRSTPEMWPDLIQKAKEGGLDAVESYIFWNAHEPRYREYNFSGNLDFVKFFKLVQEAGLYGILRIGPYICAEWNYGGLPVWLHNIPGIKVRTDNEIFKNEMEIFTTKIVNITKEANLFAPQGGPIILAQIENEYGDIGWKFGSAGDRYLKWAAEMAYNQHIGIPWIMCQQNNAPAPMINTCNGFYEHGICQTRSPDLPLMWTENWSGWYKKWSGSDAHRPVEDLAYSVARWFQYGGILNNYYMYHGGTNFGRVAGGPLVATSYDYDAPLDEYGNLNQPKWGHLKQLHDALHLGEKILTNGTMTTKDYDHGVLLTTFLNTHTGDKFCFLSNDNDTHDFTIDLGQDGTYFLPAWSVTILGGCDKELYNTAKVNVQTTVMVKKLISDEEEKTRLPWRWAPESIKELLQGKGRFRARQLIEQKAATFDESDYLWYMTSVDINGTSWSNATLYVKSYGWRQGIYAYVNGQLVGYIYHENSDEFRTPVSLKSGRNIITVLSVTVGLSNWGQWYDEEPEGLANGSVKLIDSTNTVMDLSSNIWNYKVGLNGEDKRLFDPTSPNANVWEAYGFPTGRPMTWYKTTFKTPAGIEPVVVDLIGMGKGMAWVNGNSLGRYWPASISSVTNICSDTCDYRGKYDEQKHPKCHTNCGKPTQRWYHIPRSFLTNDTNTLILFEEMGGNPSQISFPIVTTGTICGNAHEGSTLELSCNGGQVISEIQFASFGNTQGECSYFQKGSCEAAQSVSVVEQECLGRESCTIDVSSATFGIFGSINCIDIRPRLAVQALCR